jgi:hypothetical protein
MTGALLMAAGCAPLIPPGMAASKIPLARDVAKAEASTPPSTDMRLLVAFPSSACTSTESAVFMDEEARFIGSVAPGTAAELVIPRASKHLFVVGSVDVLENPGIWFVRHEVPLRTDQGVLVKVVQADGHNCEGKWSGPLSPRPVAVSLPTVVEAARGLTRLEVRAGEGRQWLDENRERVDELIGRVRVESSMPQPVATQILEPN